MLKSDLIKSVEKLSKRDFRQIKKMVASPFFNQRQDVIDLFNYLNQVADSKAQDKYAREIIFETIFPNEQMDVQKLRYTMSFLYNVIQQYFIQSEMENDQVLMQLQLCKALRKRGVGKLFQKEIKSLRQKQQNATLKNTNYHLQNYEIAFEQYEFASTYSREGDMQLGKISEYLTNFYFADLLKLSCIQLSTKKILETNIDFSLVESLLPTIEEKGYLNNIATEIYYHTYKALKHEDNETHFQELKKLISTHWDKFKKEEARDIYTLGINFCIKKLNKGSQKYFREAFELYQEGFKHELFFENGGLTSFNYKNVVKLGIGLGELEWVEHFMETHEKFLYPSERKNTYTYNLAYLQFHKKNYDQALLLLQQMEYKDILQNLDARRMILCIYYERNEFEPLHSLLKSFSTYIRRHQKDIGYHGQNYLNLIRFITKMINANLRDKEIRNQIVMEIENTDGVAEKKWLLSMLEKRSTVDGKR